MGFGPACLAKLYIVVSADEQKQLAAGNAPPYAEPHRARNGQPRIGARQHRQQLLRPPATVASDHFWCDVVDGAQECRHGHLLHSNGDTYDGKEALASI